MYKGKNEIKKKKGMEPQPARNKELAAVETEAIIDAMPDSLIVLSLDGELIRVNQAHLKMFGHKSIDEVPKGSFDTLKERFCDPEKDIPRFLELFKGVIEKGFAEKSVEMRLRKVDGKEFFVSASGSLLRDAEGNPKNVVAILRDITELKRMGEELEEKRGYAQNLIESSLDMIIAVDKDRKIIEFNKASQKTFGYSKEEVLGKYVEILYKDPQTSLIITETIEKAGRFTGETINKRKNGELFPSFISGSIVRDKEGKYMGHMGISRDITELKRAEEERMAAVQERAIIVDTMGDGLIVTDLDGNVISYNKAMEDYSAQRGINIKEFVGKSVLNFPIIRPEETEKYLGLIKEVIEKGRAGPLITMDTAGCWNSVTISLLKDAQGNPSRLFAVLRDITELKKAEEALRATNQQLRASEQQLRASNQQLGAREQALRASQEELRKKITDVERFNRLMVGRELEMVKLKEEVNSLFEKLGQPKKYEAPEKIQGKEEVI